MAWVVPDTYTVGELLTASSMNKISGDLIYLNGLWAPGLIMSWGALAAPSGFLNCDGTSYSQATFAGLFAAIVTSKGTVTVTIASPGVFTLANHGLVAGDIVYLETTGALPTGLTIDTPYWVIATGLTTNAFELSATLGGSAINTSVSQSGVHTLFYAPYATSSMSAGNFTVPDLRGRSIYGFGPAAVNKTLAANDGLGVGSRQPAINAGSLTSAFAPGASSASQIQGQIGIEGWASALWIIKT